jgi:hypothetical protein
MATYTVTRSGWYRGHGSARSKLLRRADELRCCIGFVGVQCGYSDSFLCEQGSAYDSVCENDEGSFTTAKWPGWMLMNDRNSDIGQCYQINDDPGISDAEREKKLIVTFARHGDTLVFVD